MFFGEKLFQLTLNSQWPTRIKKQLALPSICVIRQQAAPLYSVSTALESGRETSKALRLTHQIAPSQIVATQFFLEKLRQCPLLAAKTGVNNSALPA